MVQVVLFEVGLGELQCELAEIGDLLDVDALLALHGGDGDAVHHLELREVLVFLAVFRSLDALGQPVSGHLILDGLGVLFLVHDPTDDLILAGGFFLVELGEHHHALLDRVTVFHQHVDAHAVAVDAAGHLAVADGGAGRRRVRIDRFDVRRRGIRGVQTGESEGQKQGKGGEEGRCGSHRRIF